MFVVPRPARSPAWLLASLLLLFVVALAIRAVVFPVPIAVTGAAVTNIAACGTLNTPNTIYNLTGDVTQPGGAVLFCFNVEADNITIECNGFSIIAGDDLSSAILTNSSNTTIQNCVVPDAASDWRQPVNLQHPADGVLIRSSTLSGRLWAIVAQNVSNVTVEDTTFTGLEAGTHALLQATRNVTFDNVNFTAAYVDVRLEGVTGAIASSDYTFRDVVVNAPAEGTALSIADTSRVTLERVTLIAKKGGLSATNTNDSTVTDVVFDPQPLQFQFPGGGPGGGLPSVGDAFTGAGLSASHNHAFTNVVIYGTASSDNNGGAFTGLFVNASQNVSFRNVQVNDSSGGAGTSGNGGSFIGIEVLDAFNVSLSNVTVVNNTVGAGSSGAAAEFAGVFCKNSDLVSFTGVVIAGNYTTEAGLLLHTIPANAYDVYASNCSQLSLGNVQARAEGAVSDFSAGLYALQSTRLSATGWTVRDKKYGVYFAGAGSNDNYSNNVIENNAIGLAVINATNVTVDNNTILNNSQYGIYFENVTNATITRNFVRDNTLAGILHNASNETSFSNNTVRPNTLDFSCEGTGNTTDAGANICDTRDNCAIACQPEPAAPTPTPAPTPAPGTSSVSTQTPQPASAPSEPASEPAPAPAVPGFQSGTFTSILTPQAEVITTFTPERTVIYLDYASDDGYCGGIAYEIPLGLADYQAGAISISPAPDAIRTNRFTAGIVSTNGEEANTQYFIASWEGLSLRPSEVFRVSIVLNRAMPRSFLDAFTAPRLTPCPTPVPPRAPTPTPVAIVVTAAPDLPLLLAALFLAIIMVLILFFRRRKKREEAKPARPRRKPRARARATRPR